MVAKKQLRLEYDRFHPGINRSAHYCPEDIVLNGDVAQLVEHNICNVGVEESCSFVSTETGGLGSSPRLMPVYVSGGSLMR